MKKLLTILGVLTAVAGLLWLVDRGLRNAHRIRRIYVTIDRDAIR